APAAAPAPTAAPAPVQKAGTGGAYAPSPYTLLRWNEDYSALKDPANRTDFLDPIKYIPLGRDDFYLSLGGQLRERYEFFNNNNFGAGDQDDDGFLLHRLFLNADLHLGRNVRVFGQFKSSLEDGRTGGPRATDADEADVQQLFVDGILPWGDKNSTTVRFGRQDLLYGAQRLISPLDWSNTRRTFEGLKVSNTVNAGALGNHTLDLFWVRPVLIDKEEPNVGDRDASFAGVYDTVALPDLLAKGDNTKLEVYGLLLQTNNRAAVGAAPAIGLEADVYTVGVRFSTNPKPWDLDVEADYQFGQAGADEIAAWSFAVEGGYTCATVPLKPRAYVGFDIASGDNGAGGKFTRFNQLFPLGHAYFGYIDVIGRQNIVDVHPGVELSLLENVAYAKKLSLRADYHLFWRQSDADGVYNAAGGLLRAAGGSSTMFIGSEVDLLLNWQIDRHTAAYVGYSHFFAGDFIQQTGPSNDIDFAYVAVQFTF
ncbi:MAG TPA: alginate export family protein, partial [Humisphaera sp.]